MIKTIYISPDGAEYPALPRSWGGATNITMRWATAHGWTTTEREMPAPQEPLPTTCTKYEFINALKELGLYDTLYAAYAQSPELQFYWSTVQELDRNNGDFQRFASMIGAGEAQLNALFAAIAEARS